MPKMEIQVGADNSKLTSDLQKSGGVLKNFGSSINGMFSKIGIGLSAVGIAAFGKKIIEAGDQAVEGGARLGVTAEEYQQLKFAAEQSGTGIEALETAFSKMFSTIEEAEDPTSKAAEALAKLGIAFQDIKDKSPFQQIKMVMGALKEIPDTQEKVALSKNIFGKQGMKFNELSENFDALTGTAKEYGILSNEAAQAADEFGHALQRLQQTLASIATDSGFISWLNEIAQGLSDLTSNAKKMEQLKVLDKDAEIKKENERWAAEGAAGKTGEGYRRHYDNIEKIAAKYKSSEEMRTEAPTKEEISAALADKKKREDDKAKDKFNLDKLKEQNAQKKFFEDGTKESLKQAEKQREAEAKSQKGIKDYLDDMSEKIKLQGMINAGKEKEAAIQEAINNAQKAKGGPLTALESSLAANRAADLFDMTKGIGKYADMARPTISDSLISIGANRLNPNAGTQSAENINRSNNNILKSIDKTLSSIDGKTVLNIGNTGDQLWP